ncbi:helix-turn-helix domain-containing protein [Saccharothrix sp. AJ9571]|nr:helix-turn-helix domain-containing protein [Saccharothrix sp. AJ9571]
MSGPGEAGELADLLSALKTRSGMSYAELGRRTHTSGSTLHRYCTGKTTPADYRTAIRIATACHATDEDLTELLRCWRRAQDPAAEQPAPTPADVPPGPPATRRRQRVASRATTALLGITLLLLSAASAPEPVSAPVVQQVEGPAWQRERAVKPALFGMTAASSSGTMPGFRVGSLRFWDSRTRWANIQPRPHEYDWSTLDRLVEGAQRADLPALLVLGGTPAWAAPHGAKAPYDDGSRSSPPDDLTHWEQFLDSLVTRYRGRLEAYELWVFANEPRFYSGPTETLVDMTRRAQRIIKSVDPGAILVCPSMGRLWTEEGQAVLRRFAELGGYDHCDVAGIKLHQRRAADPPETMISLLSWIDDALHVAGVHPPLWNTGTTYDLPTEEPLGEQRSVDYAVRFYLVAIYGTNLSLERTYFYNWGGNHLPIVMQAVGGPPTRAALAVEELQRWLARTTTRACGHGQAINLPGNVWQCEFATEDDRRLTIRWTDTGAALTGVGPHAEELRQLDGTSAPLRADDTIEVTETPQLIVHRQ